MTDVDLLLQNYPSKSHSSKQKARLSLLLFLLEIKEYKMVGNLGIAGILLFQSKAGKYFLVKTFC